MIISLIFLTLILIGIFISSIKEDDTSLEEKNSKDIGDEKEMKYIKEFCKNCFNTQGKISKKDFLITWLLVQLIQVLLVLTIIGMFLIPIVFIGIITMTIRRLNDINKSKWYIILLFIPFLVNIIFFIYLCCANSVNKDKEVLNS